jgi:hypothetical protein
MYREEDWIDWLLGSKLPEEQSVMQAHLTTCHKCRNTVEQWAPLLQEDSSQRAASSDKVLPSIATYNSLRRHVKARGICLRLQQGIRTKSKWAVGIAAGILLLLCVWSISRIESRQPEDQRTQFVAQYEPSAVSFMDDPTTASYQVHPYNNQLGEGYVYYNDSSRELLVLVEGLLSSEGQDVQAWTVDERGHASLGLLQRDEADRAHLYLKGKALGSVHHIVLTVEPVGGSEQPTTPDAFVFHIQNR